MLAGPGMTPGFGEVPVSKSAMNWRKNSRSASATMCGNERTRLIGLARDVGEHRQVEREDVPIFCQSPTTGTPATRA